ncbi:ABC transporter permease subunit [Microbacterium sp. SYP-A9085]|uniref:ABC transporter permease n=1 Tax=Microbacterium sp. SYP-A9085 TaxID=2664454 RepID=UPI00129AFEC5|nr:ABC transporter permease [Microbacterium sp. SYP-A9085]MRH30119.1 ABC transporter permease subunit [Microbacterium sp. SYP-A9085]
MLRVLASRVPQMVIVVLGTGFLAFSIMFILPGDVVTSILGEDYSPEAKAALRAELNLDQPFFVRYLTWLGNFFTGDFGTSLVPPRQPVSDMISRALLPTIEMLVLGLLFSILLGVTLAVISVASRSRAVDRIIQGVALVCSSVPGFVLGLLLLNLLAVRYRIVSPRGWVNPFSDGWGPNLIHILFPSIVLGLFLFPLLMRVFRSELVTQLDDEDYITLARLKGISASRLVFRHAVRNSSFGLLTVVGIDIARLIAGTVIIEQIFGIPGMGTLIRLSVTQHDTPAALASVTIVAIFVVVANFAIDMLYAILDPRVREATR